MKLTDWRGNEFGVGDRVFFSTRFGDSTEVVEAEVLVIEEVESRRYNYQERAYEDYTETRVKVRGIRGSRRGDRSRQATWPNVTNLTAVVA